MLAHWTVLVASASAAATPPDATPDFRAAYEHAHRCFVVTSSYGDPAGARRAFDAVTRLGYLRHLSNRQINADFNHFTASESVRLARDSAYRNQLVAECRRLGLAS